MRNGMNTSRGTGTAEARESAREDVDWKALALKLWTACQGIESATSTFHADFAWAQSAPEHETIGSKTAGLGKSFAMGRVRHRLSYEDVLALREAMDHFKKKKIPHLNQEDKRGFVKI